MLFAFESHHFHNLHKLIPINLKVFFLERFISSLALTNAAKSPCDLVIYQYFAVCSPMKLLELSSIVTCGIRLCMTASNEISVCLSRISNLKSFILPSSQKFWDPNCSHSIRIVLLQEHLWSNRELCIRSYLILFDLQF